ncbi:MAG: putative molybdenum carrier protein [Planctomycetaceae bacterium]
MITRIVSGGQTGVDRAALDCAMGLGFEVDGWCPAGRRSEDGRIPDQYPLRETETRNYAVRTRFNVRDSDGTLLIAPMPLTRGTALTLSFAKSHPKPHLLIDINDAENSENRFAEWIAEHRIRVLNVAGPRASSDPSLYDRCVQLLNKLLKPHANQ